MSGPLSVFYIKYSPSIKFYMPLSKNGRTFEIGKALSNNLKWLQYHEKNITFLTVPLVMQNFVATALYVHGDCIKRDSIPSSQ